MKLFYSVLIFVVAMAACKKDRTPDIEPQGSENVQENKDWYILTAPDKREIRAVYGNIDSSLVITDGRKIYKTVDKGRTWADVGYTSLIGLAGFSATGDTLFALSSVTKSTATGEDLFATQTHYFSKDKGSSWSPSPVFWYTEKVKVPLNRIKSASGTEYLINRMEQGGYIETIGIKTSNGKSITLPSKHQINSLYFDQQSRLYVSASTALCGSGDEFAYCGSENGILYVSKNPQF